MRAERKAHRVVLCSKILEKFAGKAALGFWSLSVRSEYQLSIGVNILHEATFLRPTITFLSFGPLSEVFFGFQDLPDDSEKISPPFQR